MVLTTSDQTDVLLSLFGSLLAPAPWDTFLRRVLARSGAQQIVLTHGGEAFGAAVRGGTGPEQAREVLAMLGGPRLRAGRVYALAELLDFDDPARRLRQADLLDAARIGDLRLIRIDAADERPLALTLLHERPAALGATDSALLAGLAPAVAVAAGAHAALAVQRLRLDAAEEALALLGIGQAVLDRQGHVLAADALWQREGPGAAVLSEAAAALGESAGASVLRGGEAGDGAVLVRKGQGAGAVAALRRERLAEPVAAARVIAAELGLSPREAALAALLARGRGLVEAGRMLRLTEETARNYSRRIYAKTGARGQADLVRMVLQGLSVLA